MVRGRPKRSIDPVAVNNEYIAVAENTLTSQEQLQLPIPDYTEKSFSELGMEDPRDAQIAVLEKKLKDFEERFSKKAQGIEESSPIVHQKPKAKEIVLPLVTQLSARDAFELEDRKPVIGVFRMNNKKPGEKGMIKIGAMRKYKGDKMSPWIFEHGKTYTIPKWLAAWINGGEGDPDEVVKQPRCNIVTHTDQDTNLQEKRMLAAPTKHSLFSFSPVAKW